MPGSSKKRVPLTVLGSRKRRGEGEGSFLLQWYPTAGSQRTWVRGAVLMVSLKRQPSTALPPGLDLCQTR